MTSTNLEISHWEDRHINPLDIKEVCRIFLLIKELDESKTPSLMKPGENLNEYKEHWKGWVLIIDRYKSIIPKNQTLIKVLYALGQLDTMHCCEEEEYLFMKKGYRFFMDHGLDSIEFPDELEYEITGRLPKETSVQLQS